MRKVRMPFTPDQMERVQGYNLPYGNFSCREIVIEQLAHMDEIERTVTPEVARAMLEIDTYRNQYPTVTFQQLVDICFDAQSAHRHAEYKRLEQLLAEITADRVRHGVDHQLALDIIVGQLMYLKYIQASLLATSKKICLQEARHHDVTEVPVLAIAAQMASVS